MTPIEMEKDYDQIKNDPASKVTMLDFLPLIYYPQDPKISITADARLFIEAIREVQQNRHDQKQNDLLSGMKSTMAQHLYEELSLKEFGFTKSEDLISSHELAKFSLEVMEKPKLRYELRKKFKHSEHAARYLIYLSIERLSQASSMGAEEKYAHKRQEIIEFKFN